MNFLEHIFRNLEEAGPRPVLQEVHDGRLEPASALDLRAMVRAARVFLAHSGLRKGDRCALLGHNSIAWVALDLALMAEGVIVVPLYARQAVGELVGMMKDSSPALVLCGDAALREAVMREWPGGPPAALFSEALERDPGATDPGLGPHPLAGTDPVAIIYTSGTSGVPKGVVLNAGNLNHMVGCTTARLDQLMEAPPGPEARASRRTASPDLRPGPAERDRAEMARGVAPDTGANEPEQVFHYLPFCFAGSWILLLSCLSRNSVLALSMDLNKLADEIRAVSPEYFLNVPALLERVRKGVEEQIEKRGGVTRALYTRAGGAWTRRQAGAGGALDGLWLALAGRLVFPAIRSKLGPRLRALICGSAPLAVETQLFFHRIGIPVLQVYGLTETTAICTMDDPAAVTPGRAGPAIPGVEMRAGESGEIVVRGPNIFPGYWRRSEETAKVFRDGWFLTGDQGEADAAGNWRIVGRVKNLIVLNSGHKVPPEPIEESLRNTIPGAQQVVLVGTERSFLSAIVTGPEVTASAVQEALDRLNATAPHYKRIHAFHLQPEPFTIESGLLTANGKLRREAIAVHLAAPIDALYQRAARTN